MSSTDPLNSLVSFLSSAVWSSVNYGAGLLVVDVHPSVSSAVQIGWPAKFSHTSW